MSAGQAPARVVVGVDGSACSVEALREGLRQARADRVPVLAVTAWLDPVVLGGYPATSGLDWQTSAQHRQAAALDALGDDAADVQRVVTHGGTAHVLLDAVGPDDLLVVGSRGHGGFAGMLLGSVSQHVVAHAPCPVLVVRSGAR